MITIRLPRSIFLSVTVSWMMLLAFFLEASFSAEPTANTRDQRIANARIRLPRHSFEDLAARQGVPIEGTPTWGSNWFDMDSNGFPELLINRHKRSAWILSNDGSGFSYLEDDELTELPDGRTYYDRHTCSWGEADGDRIPDLYCVSGAQKGAGEGPNRLLLWDGSAFQDVSGQAGVVDINGRGRTVNWLDFDSDGDLDLFVGNEMRAGFPNKLYRNAGGRFVEVESPVAREFATMDSTWADVDGDRDPDLLLVGHGAEGTIFYRNSAGAFAEDHLPGISGLTWNASSWEDFDGDGAIDLLLVTDDRAVVWRNQAGTLREWQTVELEAGRSGVWFDADNDGDLDLYVVQGRRRGASLSERNEPDLLLMNEGDRFELWTEPGTSGRQEGSGDSVSVADHDRDGRVDVFVTNGYLTAHGPSSLIQNRSRAGNWSGLRIEGDPSNPSGFGARVRVVTSQGAYWRFLTDEMAGHAQSEVGYLHMGLGFAGSAKVRFRWPDGSDDCYLVRAGQIAVARKGAAPC